MTIETLTLLFYFKQFYVPHPTHIQTKDMYHAICVLIPLSRICHIPKAP